MEKCSDLVKLLAMVALVVCVLSVRPVHAQYPTIRSGPDPQYLPKAESVERPKAEESWGQPERRLVACPGKPALFSDNCPHDAVVVPRVEEWRK